MNTDRIQRLQSLLDRIKLKAALPKLPLGQGLVLGGARPAGSDVSAGPAVPVQPSVAATPVRSTKVTQPMPLVKPLQPEATPKPATSVQPSAPAKPAVPAQPEPIAAKSAPTHAAPSSPQAAAPMQPAPAPTQTAPQPMRSLKMTQPMQVMTPLQPESTPKPAPAPEQPVQPTPSAQPAKPSFWQSAQAAARGESPGTPSGQPAAPVSTGTSSSNMQAVHSPLVAVPSVSATMVDGRKARARVPTVIGVAPDFGVSKPEPPKAEEETIEELDEAEVLEAQSSLPPPPTAAGKEAEQAVAGEGPPSAETRRSNSDIDNLSWSEPPTVEVEIEEPPPDSSPRARVAGSIDEALAGVTVDSEPEPPVKTPPPESGRQPAEGVYAAPMPSAVPTPEQLGETVELGEPTVAELELDLSPVSPEPAKEELELELPKQASFLEPITPAEPPPRAPEPSHVEIIPDEPSAATRASARDDATLLSDSESLQLQPSVTKRPHPERAAAIELLESARSFAPRSFLELLDASLKLGSN